jgi:hypothetical protein
MAANLSVRIILCVVPPASVRARASRTSPSPAAGREWAWPARPAGAGFIRLKSGRAVAYDGRSLYGGSGPLEGRVQSIRDG